MRLFSKAARTANKAPDIGDTIRFQGEFSTFAEALTASGGDGGYESTTATDRYVRRFQEINRDMAATIATSGIQLIPFMAAFSVAEPIEGIYEIFDFGGVRRHLRSTSISLPEPENPLDGGRTLQACCSR